MSTPRIPRETLLQQFKGRGGIRMQHSAPASPREPAIDLEARRQRLEKELTELQQLARDFDNKPLERWTAKILREWLSKPTTHPHSLGHGFGDYQAELRVGGRLYIGIGHTPGEARRNVFDAVEARNPDLGGFCAVMRTTPITVERVRYDNSLFNKNPQTTRG